MTLQIDNLDSLPLDTPAESCTLVDLQEAYRFPDEFFNSACRKVGLSDNQSLYDLLNNDMNKGMSTTLGEIRGWLELVTEMPLLERRVEGGWTYLNRVLAESIKTGGPVRMIDSGGIVLSYFYEPGHQTFADGLIESRGSRLEHLEGLNNIEGQDLNHSIFGHNLKMALEEMGL